MLPSELPKLNIELVGLPIDQPNKSRLRKCSLLVALVFVYSASRCEKYFIIITNKSIIFRRKLTATVASRTLDESMARLGWNRDDGRME
jgi:hypothetical protein